MSRPREICAITDGTFSASGALRRFVVIELKIGKFEPEFVSNMNFYLNAVDEQLRRGDDRESVGIILCADRDETVAKLALHRPRS